jgi:hypothetical protein
MMQFNYDKVKIQIARKKNVSEQEKICRRWRMQGKLKHLKKKNKKKNSIPNKKATTKKRREKTVGI